MQRGKSVALVPGFCLCPSTDREEGRLFVLIVSMLSCSKDLAYGQTLLIYLVIHLVKVQRVPCAEVHKRALFCTEQQSKVSRGDLDLMQEVC